MNTLNILLYRISQRRVRDKCKDISKNCCQIDYSAIITNYDNRIEQLKKLRDVEIQEAFDRNVLSILALREDEDKAANAKIIKIIQDGITFFDGFEDKSYLLEYLYMGIVLPVFDEEQKRVYEERYIEIIDNLEDNELIDTYAIYTARVYAEKGSLSTNATIEDKEINLNKALEILLDEDQNDKDVLYTIAKVYSYYCDIFAWDYPQKAIEYGKKFLEFIDYHKIQAYSEIAKTIFDMYIAYSIGFYDDVAAENILRNGLNRLISALPEHKEDCEVWFDLFNRSIESIRGESS